MRASAFDQAWRLAGQAGARAQIDAQLDDLERTGGSMWRRVGAAQTRKQQESTMGVLNADPPREKIRYVNRSNVTLIGSLIVSVGDGPRRTLDLEIAPGEIVEIPAELARGIHDLRPDATGRMVIVGGMFPALQRLKDPHPMHAALAVGEDDMPMPRPIEPEEIAQRLRSAETFEGANAVLRSLPTPRPADADSDPVVTRARAGRAKGSK